MLGLSSLTTKLIVAGLVAAAVAGFWFHYQGLHDEIAVLQGNQRQLETALDLKDTEISVLQDQTANNNERAARSREHLWASQAKVDELEAKLERHDLALLVKRKPGLMTKVFERGTAAVHTEIEEAANATLD
jgi:Tfp pilus assembly protein PilO